MAVLDDTVIGIGLWLCSLGLVLFMVGAVLEIRLVNKRVDALEKELFVHKGILG